MKLGAKHLIFVVLLIVAVVIVLSFDSKILGSFMLSGWYKTTYNLLTSPDVDMKNAMPPSETTRSSIKATKQSKPNVRGCSFKYLSPENAKEGRELLDSITWPETQPLSKPFSLKLTTSAAKSSFTIVGRSEGWRVGDELEVKVQLRDYYGRPKKGGGDLLITRLHNRQLGAGVVGQVQDHNNGTFTVVFPLLWSGTADVSVLMDQCSESITVLKRIREEHPARVTFFSDFRSADVVERTVCNVCLDLDKAPVCNFSDPMTGEQWFCYKPETLKCSDRISHGKGPFNQPISREEESLFKYGFNMKAAIKASEKFTIPILPQQGKTKEFNPGPSGYYYRNQWRPLNGPRVRPFNNASAITACLRGKQMHIYGDSTARQYYEQLTKRQPNLQRFDYRKAHRMGPFVSLDQTNEILVTYHCHGAPMRTSAILLSQMNYVANELDRLPGGTTSLIVIGVWAHLSAFTMEVYYQRLMTIRNGVLRLQNRAPGTKVVIRSGNLRGMNMYDSLTSSDWYALQLDKVLRAVFKDMDVFVLDAWDMVQAHHAPHNVHPPDPVIKLMLDRMLSYLCP